MREAAEATKIRGDFLSSIEQNKFDFDLPDIYKRGFLKNYARYLKLDVDKILADYNAQQLSNSRLAKKSGSEWFGQMDLKKDDAPDSLAPDEDRQEAGPGTVSAPSLGRIKAKPAPEDSQEPEHEEEDTDKTFYLKIGLIFVGTLALVFVIFGLIWAILGSGGDDVTTVQAPELRDQSSVSASSNGSSNGSEDPASADSVTLIASGNVYVLVKQRNNDEELLRETLGAGDRVTLDKDGPVDILFTAGEFLTIEHAGERMRPSSSGTAKISIP